jgi:hypothetical protein
MENNNSTSPENDSNDFNKNQYQDDALNPAETSSKINNVLSYDENPTFSKEQGEDSIEALLSKKPSNSKLCRMMIWKKIDACHKLKVANYIIGNNPSVSDLMWLFPIAGEGLPCTKISALILQKFSNDPSLLRGGSAFALHLIMEHDEFYRKDAATILLDDNRPMDLEWMIEHSAEYKEIAARKLLDLKPDGYGDRKRIQLIVDKVPSLAAEAQAFLDLNKD